jgi:rhodanese-related sulfurtransferase
MVRPSEMDSPVVVDVRQTNEHTTGHLPGAHLIELGSLPQQVEALPDAATTVMCGHGERAATAASLLERAGRRDLSILDGGPSDWAATTGQVLDLRR